MSSNTPLKEQIELLLFDFLQVVNLVPTVLAAGGSLL